MTDDGLYNTLDVLQLLALEPLGGDRFRGQSHVFFDGRSVFGGQVLGQALSAACATVTDRRPHSLHSLFLLPGDPHAPIEYEVDRVRDGGSFTVREVTGCQDGKRIFTMSVSFQREEQGFSHQRPMPPAADPDALPSSIAAWKRRAETANREFRPFPIDLRSEEGAEVFSTRPRDPVRRVWARSPITLADDLVVHDTLFACVSDYGLLWTSVLPHGISMSDSRLQIASLDHSIWFHRPFRMDDWLLFAMESPNASGGRGLSLAYVYDREGTLVATVAQEGLIRLRASAP